MADGNDPGATVERELQQAQQALDDDTKARAAGLSDAAVINRLYYAAFHAVQAVLYEREFNPTSHGAVLSLFGSEIIATDDSLREHGRFLSQLSELRKQADYGYETVDEDLDALLSRTQELVTAMKTLCSSSE